ncbi:unnamed protein product [Pylaiella littoralis]
MWFISLLSLCGLNRKHPSPPPVCKLPGCSSPCYEEPSRPGRIHGYCRRSHAIADHQQQHSREISSSAGAAAAAAPAAGFDGTREYIYEGVVLFWQPPSVFSQWTPSTFVIEDMQYACAEQYMMAEKAKLFDDADIWKQIVATDDPREHKKLGRMVRGYNQRVWDEHKRAIVARGSYAKFTQNEAMRERLLDTGEKLLAEASPFDPVWGIGLRADDPAARAPQSWRGQNLLGEILQDTRRKIIAEAVEG